MKPSGLPPSGREADIVSLNGCCLGYSVAGVRLGLTSSGTVVAEAGRDWVGDITGTGDVPPDRDASYRTLRVESTRPVTGGAWHHVVAVYDEVSKSVWVSVDGFAVGEGRDTFSGLEWSSIPHQSPHWMGIGLPVQGVTEPFSGAVDEVAVYDGALSLADIRSDFLASGQSAPGGWNVPEGVTSGTEVLGPNAAKDWDDLLRCRCVDPVDTGSGNLHMPIPAVSVPGRGPGLEIEMGYNSLAAATAGSIGYGWSTTLDMRLVDSGFTGRKHVVQETGATVPFDPDGSGWAAAPGYTAT
ncbi:MAG TPA: LamG-like jellyroll fold domain-containing protein, partial [Acidimicrobiales bacterium]|nr:LamG-like jellyroll fold domain-containing protein [Acidimicrobiales bacterium]